MLNVALHYSLSIECSYHLKCQKAYSEDCVLNFNEKVFTL